MISTFDLALLGGMVSLGGLALLGQSKVDSAFGRLKGRQAAITLTGAGTEHHARLTALAGTRWLTVGALTLFIAYAHGAADGYLFGAWTDVMFHLLFVSTCWFATVSRINQAARRTAVAAAGKRHSPGP